MRRIARAATAYGDFAARLKLRSERETIVNKSSWQDRELPIMRAVVDAEERGEDPNQAAFSTVDLPPGVSTTGSCRASCWPQTADDPNDDVMFG